VQCGHVPVIGVERDGVNPGQALPVTARRPSRLLSQPE
jgi:hypothetical protein